MRLLAQCTARRAYGSAKPCLPCLLRVRSSEQRALSADDRSLQKSNAEATKTTPPGMSWTALYVFMGTRPRQFQRRFGPGHSPALSGVKAESTRDCLQAGIWRYHASEAGISVGAAENDRLAFGVEDLE
jgi:hypothetical protein